MIYKLSDIMDIIGGGTPKTSNPDYWEGDIPWLSVKDFNNDLHPEESVSKRLAKSVIYLPKKAIALPVNGSARMFKASKRQIKNIQKYLK